MKNSNIRFLALLIVFVTLFNLGIATYAEANLHERDVETLDIESEEREEPDREEEQELENTDETSQTVEEMEVEEDSEEGTEELEDLEELEEETEIETDDTEDEEENIEEDTEEEDIEELEEVTEEEIIPERFEAILIINHILISEEEEEVIEREVIEDLEVGEEIFGEDFSLEKDGVEYIESKPRKLVLVEGENVVDLYYEETEEEFEIGDNPDGLDGPEYIDAPYIYFPPSLSRTYRNNQNFSMFGMKNITNEQGDYNNIEPKAPGSLEIKKCAEKVEGKTNQWKITLGLTGENLLRTSDIVLVIDTSRSMGRGTGRMEAAKKAAEHFVDTLLKKDGNTRIALVSFASGVTVYDEKDPFKDASGAPALKKAIDNLQADGGTFTQAGLYQARALLASSKADYKNIVLLSDGEPTFSYEIKKVKDNRNEDYFIEDRGIWYTRDDLDESVYNYDKSAGDGTSMKTRIGGFFSRYYYHHGNSAISESRFAKSENNVIYTIALNAGNDGNEILNKIASRDKAYIGSNKDLEEIFQTIAGDISYAATDATITDPMGEKFSIPGIDSTNYKDKIEVTRGTISWNDDTETITWKLDTISKNNSAEMYYTVEIDRDVDSKKVYLTNGDTYVKYTNALDQDAKKSFQVPEVGINAGTIKIHYYRVNEEGTPINSTGEKISKEDAELQVQTYKDGTDLELNTLYTIDGPENVEIGGVNYKYNSIGNIGDENPTQVTLTPAQPSVHVWFAYMEVKDVTVTFNENYSGGRTYNRTVTRKTSLGNQMPDVPTRLGYTFGGWFTNSEGTGTEFKSDTIIEEDITVYAKWIEEPNVTINYKSTLGGTVSIESESLSPVTGVAKGSAATPSVGYRFINWVDKEGQEVGKENTFIPAKVNGLNVAATYTAVFQKDEAKWHTVTFEAGANGILKEGDQTEYKDILNGTSWDDAVTVPGTVPNPGYKFKEWTPKFPGTVTESKTYTAVFEKEDSQWHTVTFVAGENGSLGKDDKTVFTDILNGTAWNEAVTKIPDPIANEGYKFKEWTPKFPGTVTESATYTAVFEKDEAKWHTVTFVAGENGSLGKEAQTVFADILNGTAWDKAVTVPGTVPNPGYKFKEWTPEFPGTVTESAIYTAVFEKDDTKTLSYTVEYYKGEELLEKVENLTVLLAEPEVKTVSYDNKPEGYELDPKNSTKLPFTVTKENNIIKVHYIKKTDIIYTVKYLEKGTDKELAPEEVVFNQTYGTTVTEKAKDISGYTVDKDTKSLTLKQSGNEITFYYTEKSTGGGGGGGGRRRKDRDKDKKDKDEEVILKEEEIPQASAELNRDDHHQYIQGYPDNTVRPEGLVTREEVAAVFYRLLTAESRDRIRTQSHGFPDVNTGRWSTKHIATLAKGKVIEGYEDGTFRPGNNITRAELATIASRFDKLSPFEDNSFTDVKDHWANKYINSATQKGWVKGYPDRTFKPDQYITRAEFVTLVNNVLNRKVEKEYILPEAKQFPDLLENRWYYEPMQEAINSHHYERLKDGYEKWLDIYYPQPEM